VFVPTKVGWYFCTDVFTLDTITRHGNRYVMITRCLATGYYLPVVYIEHKSDVMSKFLLMIRRIRKNPLLTQPDYEIVKELRLDVAGEWQESCSMWTDMCADLHINLRYSSPDDKRANSHAEAAVKHLSHTAKGIMLSNSLPPEWIQECFNQAVDIRNNMPLVRNIVSKDGDTIRPREEITHDKVSEARVQQDSTTRGSCRINVHGIQKQSQEQCSH
jgi:hypothetical protein